MYLTPYIHWHNFPGHDPKIINYIGLAIQKTQVHAQHKKITADLQGNTRFILSLRILSTWMLTMVSHVVWDYFLCT
jgi:hypothetical protein